MRATRILVLLIGLVLAAAAAGETVHMRDGRKFVGKVTKAGDKLRIEMAYGTITVDQADVLIVLSGGTTQPSRPTTWPRSLYRPAVRLRPKARWNINQATHPEPIVFMLTRQLELLGDEISDQSIGRRLEQWRIALHDGKRKVGKKWLSRAEQRRH